MGIAGDFVLIVLAGFAGGLLARILRLPLLVGYIAAGVLIGPHTAGPTVVQIHDIELLAEIGVALLLFSLGLEISLRDLKPVRQVALVGGPIQIIGTAVLAAQAARSVLGVDWPEALWLGAMVSLSSTMVVLKTLTESGKSGTLASRVMLGLLVIQDLAVVPMLIILPQLTSETFDLARLASAIALAAAFLGITIAAGTRLLPRLLRVVLTRGSRELFLVAVVAVAVGLGAVAQYAGLSFALGAFVAGLILSESEFSHQALSDLVPLRDVFGLLFFVSVGMLFDPRFLVDHAARIVSVVALIFAGKAMIVGGIVRAFGYRNMAPWIAGLGLSQVGEFSFLIARVGLNSESISADSYNFALSCTVLTMVASPLVSRLSFPLGRRWKSIFDRFFGEKPSVQSIAMPDEGLKHHVVIAGSGRTGRAVARALRAGHVPVLIIDQNHAALSSLTSIGYPAILGDVTRWEVLKAAGIAHARMLVSAIPDRATNELSIERARQLNSSLDIVARAVHQEDIARLLHLGVRAVIQPEFEGGIEMVRQALARCFTEPADAETIVGRLRREMYEAASSTQVSAGASTSQRD